MDSCCSCCGGSKEKKEVYKCESCGKTSEKQKECCGKPMQKSKC